MKVRKDTRQQPSKHKNSYRQFGRRQNRIDRQKSSFGEVKNDPGNLYF